MECSGHVVCGGTLCSRGSWQKNSPQAQSAATVPARKEPNRSVCTKNPQLLSYSAVLGHSHWEPKRQNQSEIFSLKVSGGKLCSDQLVGLVEKEAPLSFMNVMPAKRMETGWGYLFISDVQHGRYFKQFSLKMMQRWGNWLEVILLFLFFKKSFLYFACFLFKVLVSQAGYLVIKLELPQERQSFWKLGTYSAHLPMIMQQQCCTKALLHWLLVLSIQTLLLCHHCHLWASGGFLMELSLHPASVIRDFSCGR